MEEHNVLDTSEAPNFSIVTPGPCNGNCAFCFWNQNEGKVLPNKDEYLTRLDNVLSKLPKQFTQISITGGEPTISPYFLHVLEVINKHREQFTKVVLTTNGTGLASYLRHEKITVRKFFVNRVDFVNVSVHSHEYSENAEVFGTTSIPKHADLKGLIRILNVEGIPVTVNHVINKFTNIERFMNFARNMGFTEVCFRKPHEEGCNLSPTKEEFEYAHYKTIQESYCPVCVDRVKIIDGMRVHWKASIPEPSDEMPDFIYELIFHPNMKLTSDWAANVEIDV